MIMSYEEAVEYNRKIDEQKNKALLPKTDNSGAVSNEPREEPLDVDKDNMYEAIGKTALAVPLKIVSGGTEVLNMLLNPLRGTGVNVRNYLKGDDWDWDLLKKEYGRISGIYEDLTPDFLEVEKGSLGDISSDIGAFFINFGFAKAGIKGINYAVRNPNKVLKNAKKITAQSTEWYDKVGRTVKRMAPELLAGGIAEVATFDPEDGTAVDSLIEVFPELDGVVWDYLKTDENDSKADIIFKQTLEGMGIGVALEVAFTPLKAWKAANKKVIQARKDNEIKLKNTLINSAKNGEINEDDLAAALPPGYKLDINERKAIRSAITKNKNKIKNRGTLN